MQPPEEWTVTFYVDDHGNGPVFEFLDSLDRQTKARFDWSIEQLRIRNIQAGEPLVRHIDGRIWELRRERNTNIYRLFYCFLSGRRILFLHGFQKKTQKTPRREITIAERRLENFLQRGGGD